MNELKKRREYLKETIESKYSSIIEMEKELESLNKSVQLSNFDLYKSINEIVSYTKSEKKYEHILGGDGRSQPWSEQREGLVIEVTIKEGVFLNSTQEEIVKSYINDIEVSNKIIFKK